MTRRAALAGLALALLAAPGAAAATEWARPAEAARPCPRYGAGFVQIPGSGTCIRIAGQTRAEVGASTRGTSTGTVARDRIAGSGVSARVSSDTRTETGYGTLRTYVRVRAGERY